jgi:hypothetical protein
VPEVAIGSDQQGPYVLIVSEKNVVERRGIRTGPFIENLRVIEEGINGKEWVIINGLIRAVPGRQVTPEREGVQTPGTGLPQTSDQRKAKP